MKKRLTKTEILKDIERLEIKTKYVKKDSVDKRYPVATRNRLAEKVHVYAKEIKDLQKQLKKTKNSDEPPFEGTKRTNLKDSSFEDYSIEVDDREEIDFSDNKKALDSLSSMYPEGLEDLDLG